MKNPPERETAEETELLQVFFPTLDDVPSIAAAAASLAGAQVLVVGSCAIRVTQSKGER